MTRPIASLSLDLDNKWSYLKVHGDPSWEQFPSYLDEVVPRILESLDALRVSATVFVVGQDAALPQNGEALAALGDSRHEVANHSFHHEPWLHRYSRQELETELTRAEEAILAATGRRTCGFRGPGYTRTDDLIRLLVRRGYWYDASTLPTFLGPLARAYYFLHSTLSSQQRDERGELFGSLRDGFLPLCAHWWEMDEGQLVEIPVSTMPILRLPIHMSYLVYLSTFSRWLARRYWHTALRLCRWTRLEPSLLLHPLDFLGAEDDRDLGFFPGMNMPRAEKHELVTEVLTTLADRFDVCTLADQARQVWARAGRTPPTRTVADRRAEVLPVG